MLKVQRIERKEPTLDKDCCLVWEARLFGEAESHEAAYRGLWGILPLRPGCRRTRLDLKWSHADHRFEGGVQDTEARPGASTPASTGGAEIVLRDVREVVNWERVPVCGGDGKALYVEHRLVVRTGA